MFGMFLTLKIDTLLNRFAIRNDVKHEIKLQNGKLKCDCKDALFVGVPCRHLLALVTKEKELEPKSLPINNRWRKDYYKEEEEEEERKGEEKKEETNIQLGENEANLSKNQEPMVFQLSSLLNIIDAKS